MDPANDQKRKPRRTSGTPSYYYRNRFAYGVLAAGCALFGFFYITPVFRKFDDKICEYLQRPNVEQYERRALFQLPAARTRKFIEDTIKEKEEYEKER